MANIVKHVTVINNRSYQSGNVGLKIVSGLLSGSAMLLLLFTGAAGFLVSTNQMYGSQILNGDFHLFSDLCRNYGIAGSLGFTFLGDIIDWGIVKGGSLVDAFRRIGDAIANYVPNTDFIRWIKIIFNI